MITVSDDEPFSDENMHAQACIIMPHVKQNETTKNQNMFVFVTFCHYLLLTLDDNLKQYCKCFKNAHHDWQMWRPAGTFIAVAPFG